MKTVNIAILGLGTVGGGTYQILQMNHTQDIVDLALKYRKPGEAALQSHFQSLMNGRPLLQCKDPVSGRHDIMGILIVKIENV